VMSLVDLLDPSVLPLGPETHIYIRYDSMYYPEHTQRAMLLLTLFARDWTVNGFHMESNILSNKLTQLTLLGPHCPRTRVSNQVDVIQAHPHFVVKGISTLKTRADLVGNIDPSENAGSIPVMLQEPLYGDEYKLHGLYREDGETLVNVRGSSASDAIDKRFADTLSSYTIEPSIDGTLQELSRSIHRQLGLRFFDVDCIRVRDQYKVLEINDSPENTFFERKTGASFFKGGLFKE
ncbi:MAG: hypothetical protein M3Q07_04505, partial [Pseudobdellovibrionaceae bacterium]|nr:hypothetical protein [Pseudobdellovibrionaceae bacterium]